MASYSHRPMSRSSGRHHHAVDIMSSTSALLPGGEFVDDAEGPFDVVDTKKAPLEVLLRWRKAVLTLNGSRRFRYTVDLVEELEKDSRRRMIRSRAQVERVRKKLVHDWLPVLIVCKDNTSPLTPNNRPLYLDLEETFLKIISTLPMLDAKELLQQCLVFSNRNFDDCPHLVMAFNTWFRRAARPPQGI